MTPHSPIRDRFPRGPSNPRLRLTRGLLAALALATLVAAPAAATVNSVVSAPADPRTCDSVTLTVDGTIPSPCYEIVGAKITGPEPIPCMSPGPCPLLYRIDITVREPNNAIAGPPCPLVLTPYLRSFDLGALPEGRYIVNAVERMTPFGSDSTIDSSFVSTTFTVRRDSTCQPALGCYILDVVPDVRPPDDPFPRPGCTATTPPGGTACLDLGLFNSVPVGGVQTTVAVAYLRGVVTNPFIHATSVEAVGRASGFQVGWTADGPRTKLILYSSTGALIPEGRGPIVRICFEVPPETAPGVYPVNSTEEIVADSTGTAIMQCPTFAPIQGGTICVASPTCDVNGDGASDILDIIKLVRCALGAGADTTACPDSVAARADCNGDGSLDVRDIICCVRKILEFPTPTPLLGAPTGAKTSEIGFNGPVRWINEVEGIAIVELKHGDDWGGTQFSLDRVASPVRVRDVKLLDDPVSNRLEWANDMTGGARVILYAATNESRRDGIVRMQVAVERTLSAGAGLLRLVDARTGTLAGAPAPTETFNATLEIREAVADAPALLAARPNPFLGRTEAGFALPRAAHVSLRLYDVAGRLVKTLVDEVMPAGVHHARWDGTDSRGRPAPAAIYFARFEAENVLRSERWLLLR